MHSVTEAPDTLTVDTRETGLARLLLACAVLLLVWAICRCARITQPWHDERCQGLTAGTVVCLIGWLALFEQARFVFDRRRQLLLWQRRRVLSTRSGSVAFADIQSIGVQTPLGDEGVPSRRIMITAAGAELPLSIAYVPDHGDERLFLAERLRRFVGGAERTAPVPGAEPAARA